MRTKKDMDLIFKHTHNDYKGINKNGDKSVLYYDAGTHSQLIKWLPENIYNDMLAYAQSKEAK